MNKQGLSTIVITLILILLSIVAVGIVWAVVSNIIKSGTEQVNTGFGQLFITLELQNVHVEANGDLTITVNRNVGAGDISAIYFIISDGENSETIQQDTTIPELGSETFTIPSSELEDLALIKEVSIAPVSGETLGNIADKEELSTTEIIQNLGAVSWWKLDGNANDEVGANDGAIQGSLTFVEGKFGQAGDFSSGKGIDIGTDANLNGADGFTYSVWLKRTGTSTYQWPVIFLWGNSTHSYYGLRTNGYEASVMFEYGNPPYAGASWASVSETFDVNEWEFFAVTYDGSKVRLYKDGAYKKQNNIVLNPAIQRVKIGSSLSDGFVGQIDESIFFNRVLTDDQIRSLYELDLSS